MHDLQWLKQLYIEIHYISLQFKDIINQAFFLAKTFIWGMKKELIIFAIVIK